MHPCFIAHCSLFYISANVCFSLSCFSVYNMLHEPGYHDFENPNKYLSLKRIRTD